MKNKKMTKKEGADDDGDEKAEKLDNGRGRTGGGEAGIEDRKRKWESMQQNLVCYHCAAYSAQACSFFFFFSVFALLSLKTPLTGISPEPTK